jgi:hypothetical protein
VAIFPDAEGDGVGVAAVGDSLGFGDALGEALGEALATEELATVLVELLVEDVDAFVLTV